MSLRLVIINIGNTSVKVWLAAAGKEKALRVFPAAQKGAVLASKFAKTKKLPVVYFSVVPALSAVVRKRIPLALELTTRDVPMGNLYRKKETLGIDRILAAYAAREKYGSPAVILDLGTATTLNVINSKGEFAGGLIMPGAPLFTEYLEKRTALLPRVNYGKPSGFAALSTEAAIRNGAYWGLSLMADGVLSRAKKKFKAIGVLTGGFAPLLSGDIPAADIVDSSLAVYGAYLAAVKRMTI